MSKKLLLIIPFILNSLIANDIKVSENFIPHYCQEIQDISISNIGTSKEDLISKLKIKAKNLNGNSLIKVNFNDGFFGEKSILDATVANCDISKSPHFFLKDLRVI